MITHLLMAGVFAAPDQTVTMTGIGSTVAMGTAGVVSKIKPDGQASSAAIGSPALSVGSPPAAPGLGVVSQQFVNRAGGYPLDTTVVADLTGAGGVLIFVSTASGVTWVPTVDVGGMAATYLGKSPDGASTGTVWAFSLLSPPTGSAVNVRVLKADQYADQGVIAVLGMAGAQSYGFFDAKAGGASITLEGTTTKTGGKIFSYAHGHFTSGALTLGASTPTGIEQIGVDSVNADHTVKLASLDYTSAGVAVSINWTVPFNQVNGCCVEVEGALVAPALVLNPPSIVRTSAVGTPVVSRGNEQIIAPPGIHTTVIGSPTVIKQPLAIWDAGHKHADLTISGSPATVVEKTANAATHSVVLATIPVVSGEKKYFEVTVNVLGETTAASLGFTQNQSVALNVQLGAFGSSGIGWDAAGNARQDNAGLASRLAWVAGDVLMFAVDMANGWVFFGKNGAWENAGNASQAVDFTNGNGKANNTTLTTSNPAYPAFDGHIVGDKVTANFGRAAFAYTPPTGFTALDAGGPAKKTLNATSIDTTAALGSHTLNQGIKAPGYKNLSELGSPLVKAGTIIVNPAGINSGITLGNPTLHYIVAPTGIPSAEGLGAPFVYEDVWVYPPSIINLSEIGSAKIILKIQMTGLLADQSVLGSPLVAPVLKLTVPSIVNAEAFGTGKLVLQIKPASIQNDSALGDLTSVAKVQVSGLGNVSGLGSHSIISNIKLGVADIPSTNGLGEHEIKKAPIILTAPGIPGEAATGDHRISFLVRPAGILNVSALGNHRLSFGALMAPSIINVNNLGNHEVNMVIGETTQFTKVNGQWVPVKTLMVRYENVWQEVGAILEKKNGAWVQIY